MKALSLVNGQVNVMLFFSDMTSIPSIVRWNQNAHCSFLYHLVWYKTEAISSCKWIHIHEMCVMDRYMHNKWAGHNSGTAAARMVMSQALISAKNLANDM